MAFGDQLDDKQKLMQQLALAAASKQNQAPEQDEQQAAPASKFPLMNSAYEMPQQNEQEPEAPANADLTKAVLAKMLSKPSARVADAKEVVIRPDKGWGKIIWKP